MQNVKVYKAGLKEFNEFYKHFIQSIKKDFPELPKEAIDFYSVKGYPKNLLRKQTKEEKRVIYIAKQKSKIVGYLLALQDWGGVNIALWLAVDKNFREKGIGSELLRFWEEDSKQNKNHALMLYTSLDENLKFYEKRGFEYVGALKNSWFHMDTNLLYKHI